MVLSPKRGKERGKRTFMPQEIQLGNSDLRTEIDPALLAALSSCAGEAPCCRALGEVNEDVVWFGSRSGYNVVGDARIEAPSVTHAFGKVAAVRLQVNMAAEHEIGTV